METGRRVAEVRKKLLLTQQQFAKRLGVSRSYLAGIESGHKLPSREFLLSLSETTGTSTDWVLTGLGKVENDTGGNRRPVLTSVPTSAATGSTASPSGTGDDSGTYRKSERSDFPTSSVPTSATKVGTEHPPDAPLTGATTLETVQFVVERIERASKTLSPQKKAEAVAVLCRLVDDWTENGLSLEAIEERIRDVLRLT